MWISIKEAKMMWINLTWVNFRDRISETYGWQWLKNNQPHMNKDTAKYWTKKEGHFYKWIKFKSELEIKRYCFLELSKTLGLIQDFKYEDEKFVLQEWFKFNGKTYYVTTYTPDFTVYLNDWRIIYEDTKSDPTSKNSTYKVKSKIFVWKYLYWKDNVDFKEIFNPEENYFNS